MTELPDARGLIGPSATAGRTTAQGDEPARSGARYTWSLPMPLQAVKAIDRVEDCCGCTATQRGPIVYAWEGAWGDERVPFRRRLTHGGFSAVWKLDRPPAPTGCFVLQTLAACVECRNLEIVGANGNSIFKGLPVPAVCEKGRQGKWSLKDGVLRQDNLSSSDTRLRFGKDLKWQDCTIRFQARRLNGREGFIFLVRDEGAGRNVMVNLGGWNNTQHALETHGYDCYAREVVTCPGKLETGKWYDVEIVCVDDTVAVKLDGRQLFAPTSIPCDEFR